MDYASMQRTVDAQIRKFGVPALLRNEHGDRACWASVIEYKPMERPLIFTPTDRRALISPLARDDGSQLAPPRIEDRLVLLDPVTLAETETLRMVASAIGKIQTGAVPVMHDVQVRK